MGKLRQHPGPASRQPSERVVQELSGKELADGGCNLVDVGLQCEMARVQKADDPIGDVSFERLRARRQEERVVLPPNR